MFGPVGIRRCQAQSCEQLGGGLMVFHTVKHHIPVPVRFQGRVGGNVSYLDIAEHHALNGVGSQGRFHGLVRQAGGNIGIPLQNTGFVGGGEIVLVQIQAGLAGSIYGRSGGSGPMGGGKQTQAQGQSQAKGKEFCQFFHGICTFLSVF